MSKTDLTIEGIFKSLDDWREERGLQHTVGNIAANIGEEIVEYLRAENDEQRIDALCDMFVFSANGLSATNRIEYDRFIIDCDAKLHTSIIRRDWLFDIASVFSNLLVSKHIEFNLISILKYSAYQVRLYDYDFLIAMDETLKEIHSRTGAMNEATGKWEKFKTEEAMALWYKADYSKAKINEAVS